MELKKIYNLKNTDQHGFKGNISKNVNELLVL